MSDKKTVLFLCTGNYFRSRLAEQMFNHYADKLNLPWEADSSGLIQDMSSLVANIGNISEYTKTALKVRGITLRDPSRWPKSVTIAELEGADRVIAVKESEHKSMIEEMFPQHSEKVEYWKVDDIDVAEAGRGIGQIENNLLMLLQALRKSS